MNPQVNAVANRLSLRPPQRRSLEILDRMTEIVSLTKDADVATALEAIKSEFPGVTDFEREFPSVCFALATGVGKTRLMGAFVAYLHLGHGIENFFVMAPNLTIYNKLIADFTPNTPKYVFKGIAEFANVPPEIITGDNYESRGPMLTQLVSCKINIFNISKINSEVRGGRSPRIKRLSEYIGQSYFDYLSALPDLVLLMDESHRYRASAGVKAINELKPVLGLEMTATPHVETQGKTVYFSNIIYNYPIGQAMADGFVKEPAVVTRKDFNPASMKPAELELVKLEDAIGLHERTKVQLEIYARENGVEIVKPFVLVIARDTTHAAQLLERIQGPEFFDGRYSDKVIQVDSSQTGAAEDAMIERLLRVEHADEPTEIVIHVDMLKEGWDVTNLYTIVPLRTAKARTLIEQSIGRGLRLPYGKRTGDAAVDRLSIVAHDRFQEIVDEANRPDSIVKLQEIRIDPAELSQSSRTVVSQPLIERELGIVPPNMGGTSKVAPGDERLFATPEEERVAQVAYEVIQRFESRTESAPAGQYLLNPEVQEMVLREVRAEYDVGQLPLAGIAPEPDLAGVVAKTAQAFVRRTIDIPRISVMPKTEVRSGYGSFTLDLGGMNYQPVAAELWSQYLRTGKGETLSLGGTHFREARLEDHVVAGLIDFDDVAYDSHADVLYDLAKQTVDHLRGYLSEDETEGVLRFNKRQIATLIHAQMQDHYWEDEVEYETNVTRGFTKLKDAAYAETEDARDFRLSPADKSNMAKYVFGGFERCLYPLQKFDSEAERVLAVILDRDADKWFRPVRGQFQITYRMGANHLEYQPDFVAEDATGFYMLEPKMSTQMAAPDVLAKKAAAVLWCERATEYTATYDGKAWRYALIPHNVIAENMSLAGLVATFGA